MTDQKDDLVISDGFIKTKLSDLPGISETAEKRIEPCSNTLAGIADVFSESTPTPDETVERNARERIRSELSESQMETLRWALPAYAETARVSYDLEFLDE